MKDLQKLKEILDDPVLLKLWTWLKRIHFFIYLDFKQSPDNDNRKGIWLQGRVGAKGVLPPSGNISERWHYFVVATCDFPNDF